MKALCDSPQYLKGVGPKKYELLKKLKIFTVEDLIFYFPREYTDLREISTNILDKVDNVVSTYVEVLDVAFVSRARNGMTILRQRVGNGEVEFHLTWFNQEYLRWKYKPGDRLLVSGTLKRIGGQLQISNPICESENSTRKIGNINPVYKQTKGMNSDFLAGIVKSALNQYLELVEENLPNYIITEYSLQKRRDAIINMHFPKSKSVLDEALRRFKFEELLIIQLSLLFYKQSIMIKEGVRIDDADKVNGYIEKIPFELTNAQKQVLEEIFNDMKSDVKMNRLVQGDVGSGKTIVAFFAMLKSFFANFQSVMIAPTEVLAVQHFESLNSLLKVLGLDKEINITLLSGQVKQSDKNIIKEGLANGDIDIAIGTHALLEDDVLFKNLGLIVTDEQHRFGVVQRSRLENKGENPDVLVMSATPIPRTLALIFHGDLDISIIDELPPGRVPIKTYSINSSILNRMYNFIRDNLDKGLQTYIVCPLIDESEKINLKSAETLYEELREGELKRYSVGLLHGKMSPKEKDSILREFVSGEIGVLISTTVIEVGVNVPNANIMVIYNADRFGLSQLHQLRGRVGRGNEQSYCILINDNKSEISYQRMKILESSNDGFKISEKDFELRGSGDVFGTRQHGLPDLKYANLFEDMALLKEIQKLSERIIRDDSQLIQEKNRPIKKEVEKFLQKLYEQNISFN